MGAPVGPPRVWVFIDAQNLYKDARDAFHDPHDDPASFGQVYPDKLATLFLSMRTGPERQLDMVRVYTGAPSNARDPKGYRAHMKQKSVWIGAGVKVFARMLQYPRDGGKPHEKGVDVHLAVDLVRYALVEQMFDVGIVVSTDTDLVPALETIIDSPGSRAWGWPRVETFCWAGLDKPIRPTTSQRIWCYYPNREQYEAVRDHTNYTL
jgi:uncharacterized LabA/DUF88 family protein